MLVILPAAVVYQEYMRWLFNYKLGWGGGGGGGGGERRLLIE